MMENKKFCPLPWIFQATRTNGDIRVCCQANTSDCRGIYRKENGDAYNANHDSLQESRNCQMAKEIRRTMLLNEDHEACIRCDREDASGIRSRRVYETENAKDDFTLKDAKILTNSDGSINTKEVPVTYMDLRFGNRCNLKCRMCWPGDSSLWYDDHVKIWGTTHFDDTQGRVHLVQNENGRWLPKNDDYAWVDSEHFWKDIETNIPTLKLLHTVGGEPLLIDQHYDLLQKFVDSGRAPEITIEYNSNITKIPQRAWDIWKHFEKVQIGASIDAVGKANEYIRYPSKWSIIEENINKFDKAEGNFVGWITTTVQAYNALAILDLIKWKLRSDFKRINSFKGQILITTHPLHNPNFLNIKILPAKAKTYVAQRYEEFFPWLNQWLEENAVPQQRQELINKETKKILYGYIDYMNAEDWSHLLPKFWHYTKKLDKLRSENFEDIFPTMAKFISEHLDETVNY